MSEDGETTDEEKKKVKKRPPEEAGAPANEPAPKDEEFFLWLEKLFSDGEMPEKLDLRVVELRRNGKEVFGALIQQKLFRSNAKIDKERIVALSNELMHLAQRDCNVQRKALVYGIYAQHFARENSYYERYLMRVEPNASFGKHAPELADARDEDGEPTILEKFGVQILTHQQHMFQMFATGFEGIVDRLDRALERADSRIEKQDVTIQRQSEMMERAMSMESEREERRRWTDLKIKGAERIIEFGASIAPPLLGQLIGKPVSNETPESITLKRYFKVPADGGLCTQEQVDAIFGVYDEKTNATLKPGVLSKEQATVLWRVAQCQAPPELLDELLPGGTCAVSQEQFAGLLQCGLSMEQLAPLQIIFQGRMNQQQARQ